MTTLGQVFQTPYGLRFVDNAVATEIKTGYQALTIDNRWQIIKDAYLSRTVAGYQPLWRFYGTASEPLLQRLRIFGFHYEFIGR